MDGERTFERIEGFVARHFPEVEVIKGHYGPSFRGHTTGPCAEAIRESYAFAFGRPCCFTRQGGTIGAVKAMEEVLGAEVHFLGLSLPSHGYHAPNENFDWGQASGGMAAFARYFQSVSGIQD
jgi:acetylornithine deacetylase/succinyl-diaminopimelate desuccinylase-like protein